jgi:hypothetical protein
VLVTTLVTARKRAPAAALLLVGPALLLPWRLWLSTHQVESSTPDYNAPHLLSPQFLLDRVDRLTYAIRIMLHAPFSGPLEQEPRTIAIVVLALVVILVCIVRLPAIATAVTVWLTLSFLALASIYWTSRVEIGFYVATSASRVGTTLIVAAAVLTPLLLGLALQTRSAGAPRRAGDGPD